MSDIEKRVHIAAPVSAVWASLTDPEAISAWMGDDGAEVDLRVGGAYALFDGETTGAFVLIDRPERLEYTWRQSTWQPDWEDSLVTWQLSADDENTDLMLIHSRFPNAEERESHDEGWDLYWLEPMIDYLEHDSDI